MNVDHTDQSPLEIGTPNDIDVEIGDLSPLAADRAADGTRSKLTAAPPPIPGRARRTNTLPPPIPRAARGSSAPKLVEPKATPEMMASWQINPEGPLTRPSSPPPIPVATKSSTMRAVEPPVPPAPPTVLPTTIELVRAIDVPKPEPVVVAPLVTGNAPSVMTSTTSSTALPVVQQEIIPSPRESRVAPLPTSQPGADVADLPVWPAMAPTMGAVLASRAASRDSARLPAPRGRNTLPPPIPTAPTNIAPPVLVAPEVAKKVSALDGSDGWVFDDEYEEREVDGEVVPTTYFERTEPPPRRRPAYLIAAGAAAAAIAVIVAIAMHGSASAPAPTPAPAPAVAVAPVAAPTPVAVAPAPAPVQPVAAPVVAAPSLTTLPITSWPNGATVTLVDNGNATVLGRTPVSAALDPSHSYDVVLAVVGRPTVVKHVDFATMHEVAVDLDPDPAAKPQVVAPAVETTAPPIHHHHHDHAVVAAMAAPTPPVREPAKPKQVAIVDPFTPAGTGTLMVSAKPPCEIIVDGKSTHLMTPQRAIALSPGAHAVTLVNASIGVRKTIAVKVEAKKPTKLIQDFTKS